MPCSGEQLDPGAGFEFVKLNQAAFSVRAMCRVLGLSPSGYYAWLDRKPSEREKHDAVLTTQIETIWKENREVYGRPRIFAELKEDGEEVGEKRVGRLMKQAGIVGVSRRRLGPRTTNRNVDARPATDLVERDFTADGPDQLWVADITYIPTWAGFLVPSGGRGRMEPSRRRLVDGNTSQDRARFGRDEHGRLAAPPRAGDPS